MNERKLIFSSSESNLAEVIKKELSLSQTCIIISAFIGTGLHNMLIRQVEQAVAEGKQVKILTSTMGNFNRPDVLKSFQNSATELRIYSNSSKKGSFHVKSYIFLSAISEDHSVIILGSSNFTEMGLAYNKEWNILLRGDRDVIRQALDEFNRYWNSESFIPDESFYSRYKITYQHIQRENATTENFLKESAENLLVTNIEPNMFQHKALDNLQKFRDQNIDRALVVAATGTGKTYLASMDFKQSGYGRILFVAHRENILHNAKNSLEDVIGKSLKSNIVTGNTPFQKRKPQSKDEAVFAMVSTLSKHDILKAFPKDFFDYIVIDEFHHAAASTYQTILEYFQPSFLLGLTATPERMDGRDIFKICDNNVAYEIRLFDAIEGNLLVPFYYFAIYDEVDYSQVRWTGITYDKDDLENLLSNDTRAKLVLNNLEKFLPADNVKTKALGFCVNRGHARFMKKNFDALGKESEVVLGDTPESERKKIIKRLVNEEDPLEVIFSVDVFTEGVDIPELTHILLLRPTESFTVFQQQIGRGLRLHKGKDFIVILDFIGNYKTSFIPYLTLRGITSAKEIKSRDIPIETTVPTPCFVDENLKVRKIQENEIRKLFSRDETWLYREIYSQVRDELGHNLSIIDVFDHPSVDDMKPFFKHLGNNWLRVKQTMNDLTEHEQNLLDTSAEDLLQHIEQELNPSKSYKMAVLQSLIEKEAGPEGWSVDDIALDFKKFYLTNRRYLADYVDMSRTINPEDYPLTKVRNHILKMPLKFLSNSEDKFFLIDQQKEHFYLKEGRDKGLHNYWNDENFKQQVSDRITYALKNYFFGRGTVLHD